MDSRLRGNDIRNRGNGIVGGGMTGENQLTPTLLLPPQGGGNIRIFAMTIRKRYFLDEII